MAVEERENLPSGRSSPLWRVAGAVAPLALLLVAVQIPSVAALLDTAHHYLPIHSVMEAFSVGVSILVFGVGWNTWNQDRPGNLVVLSVAFLAVAALDFGHLMSYSGMPDLVTPSGPEKAIQFWLAARYAGAFALLAVVIRPWRPFATVLERFGLLALCLGYVAAVYALVLFWQESLPHTFIPGQGLTPLKIGAEYALIAVHAVTAVLLMVPRGQSAWFPNEPLLKAVLLLILSELAFTLYASVSDASNLLGHVYKVLAYYFVYRVFVAAAMREPYQRYRRSEDRYRRVTEQASDGIFTVDARGRCIDVNPRGCEITGYSQGELVGLDIRDLLPEGIVPAEDGRAGVTVGADRTIVRELQLRRKDGTVLPVEVSARLLENGDLIAILRDIGERKRMEEDLRQAQKMEAVGQLTGGIAHDFNNLLTVTLGNLEMLADSLSADGEQNAVRRRLVDTALQATLRGSQLVQRLLSFARRQPLSPKAVDMVELVDGMRDLLRQAVGSDIEIRVEAEPDVWPARVDPAQTENALLNLAINARDAMPNGGRLTIRLSNMRRAQPVSAHRGDSAGDFVAVEVTDTGVGMAAKVAARAFEPFFTTKEVGKGSGLGLSMVYGFVRQSGGNVTIASAPGRGTTISLHLPRAAAPGTVVGANEPTSRLAS